MSIINGDNQYLDRQFRSGGTVVNGNHCTVRNADSVVLNGDNCTLINANSVVINGDRCEVTGVRRVQVNGDNNTIRGAVVYNCSGRNNVFSGAGCTAELGSALSNNERPTEYTTRSSCGTASHTTGGPSNRGRQSEAGMDRPPPTRAKPFEVPELVLEELDVPNPAPTVGLCIICVEKTATMLLLPCAHKSMCNPCAMEYARTEVAKQPTRESIPCPHCRGEVTQLVRIRDATVDE